jgi:DNA mismatch repair ATPase MutL
MKKLIEDWFEIIKWQFTCQHWRPSFVKISKQDIEKLFDR